MYPEMLAVLATGYYPLVSDALLFHTRANGDDAGLFPLAVQLYNGCCVRTVALNGGDGRKFGGTIPGEANAGVEVYRQTLCNMGVPPEKMVISSPADHTKQENDAFLDLAITHGWKSAIIIAHLHQLPRAVLGMLKSMDDHSHLLRIYTAFPSPDDWFRPTRGSQGEARARRLDDIAVEREKIPGFQAKGDLASYERLFTYIFNDRDRLP